MFALQQNFKTMKYIYHFFILLLFICSTNSIYSQDSVNPSRKNTFYGTAAVYYGVIGNLNYERKLKENDNRFINEHWLKLSYGAWEEFFGSNGNQYAVSWIGLTGKNNNHLEFSLGLASLYDKSGYNYLKQEVDNNESSKLSRSNYYNFKTSFGVAYRFQKPNGRFIFRSGLGWPEILFISTGVCF